MNPAILKSVPLPKIIRNTSFNSHAYSKEYKIKALLLLKNNNYNLTKTCKQLGVPIQTLSRWRNQIGVEVFREDEKQTRVIASEHVPASDIPSEVQRAKEEISQVSTKIFEIASNAEQELIERIRLVAKDSSNLDHLSRCLKVIHEIVTGKPAEGDEGLKVANQTNSYYQLIMTQIIKVEEDLKWKEQQDQLQLNQSKSLAPSPLKV